MPQWRLGVGLAFAIGISLGSMPLAMAGAFLWYAVWALVAFTRTMSHMLAEQHHVRQRLEVDRAAQAAQIAALEASLARARMVSDAQTVTEVHRLYGQVGLRPGAPDFLVQAARRAFRSALHPDRHPQHAQRAHDRFLQAEAVFNEIERLRA